MDQVPLILAAYVSLGAFRPRRSHNPVMHHQHQPPSPSAAAPPAHPPAPPPNHHDECPRSSFFGLTVDSMLGLQTWLRNSAFFHLPCFWSGFWCLIQPANVTVFFILVLCSTCCRRVWMTPSPASRELTLGEMWRMTSGRLRPKLLRSLTRTRL